MKRNPILEPVLIIVFGVLVIIGSTQIKTVVESIVIGPDFMPMLIGWLFVACGVVLFPECWKKQKQAAKERNSMQVKVSRGSSFLSAKEFTIKNMHFIVWVLALVYALLMESIGFLFDSIVFMFVVMVLLTMRDKKRNWVAIVLISLVLPTAVYIIFRQRFYLMLPMGLCKYIPLRILR